MDRKSSLLTAFLVLVLTLVSCTSPRARIEQTVTPQLEPPQSGAVVPSPTLAVTRAANRAAAGPASPTPRQEPSQTPTQAPSRSVVLISFDAGRADLVYDFMAKGTLPHFASLAETGVRAEWAQSVDPSLTASAHNSISTGAYPGRTGIVSNAFHNANDSFYWYRQGFDELIDRADPVWVTASRAGLKTAAVFFAGGSPAQPAQSADLTVGYGIWDAYSRQEKVPLSASGDWVDAPDSFSPALKGSFQISEVARVHLLVMDTTDDQAANYDTVLLNTRLETEGATPPLATGEWGSLVLLPASTAGADFLVQEITPRQVKIFHTAVHHNTAAPRALLESLNERFGFFPAEPDSYALEHGWITVEDFLYMMERYSRWMAAVAAWVNTAYRPDLLLTWQDTFDSAGHHFFLQDPRQQGYTLEKAGQYAAYYHKAAEMADQALSILMEDVDLESTTVMLVADHGMAPCHTNVYPNTVLEQAGLLVLDGKNYVVVEKSKAFAVASGGSAHIYINLEGREPDGIVSNEEYAQVQQQIVDLLAGLEDPATGEVVFQRVLARNELDSIGLDHPNSGDVFVQANPGYSLDGWRGNNFVFKPSFFYGQHGYDSRLPEMGALFIAAGGGIPSTGSIIPPVKIVDYAPTIAWMLGFEPSPSVDGSPIPALVAAESTLP